ncbi:hypothetical protein OUZ56_028916 [Daphnia magna]|uniref:Uncharacterized protein n=1 Tax=Daphnia magna TaxID=35525 RepID=A0ABR0B5A2_9CRUS|nr:hypothetical protein OUZ56_028916 [Daphnia magna]
MPQYLFFNEFDSERQMAKSSPPFFVLLALTGAGIGILATSRLYLRHRGHLSRAAPRWRDGCFSFRKLKS